MSAAHDPAEHRSASCSRGDRANRPADPAAHQAVHAASAANRQEPPPGYSRRDLGRLGMAALGGWIAGNMAGCGPRAGDTSQTGQAAEPHLCRGLNACANQGASGNNACRGQGDCATIAHHTCGGQNDCRGQGGCGAEPALNDCKGQGHCAVPLMESAWEKVRARFERQMQEQGLSVGEAPPPS